MTWAIVTGMAIGAVVGGGSAALQNKDVLQGALMGGVVGGVSGGIGSLGTTAATTAGEAALASAGENALASSTAGELGFSAAGNVAGNVAGESVGAAGGSGIGALTGGEATNFMGTGALPTRMAPAFDYGAGNASSQIYADATPAQNVSSFFNTAKNYYGDNQGTIGLAGLAGGMAPNTDQPEEYDMGTIRPYTYSAGLNPGYTGAGTPYFNQRYTAGTPYAAAEGGIMRLANGGSAVSAYNKILADRAQQEYVNSPPLGAFRSHFNDPVAPPPNADTTNMLYQKYLGRDAQAVGLAAHRNATADQITYGILSSPEYLKANPGATAPKLPSNSGKINYVYNPGTGGYTTSQSDKDSEEGAAHGGLMRYATGGVVAFKDRGQVSGRDNNDAPTVRELLEILGNDRDKYERLASGEEYNRKDYSANEIQAAKLLHTANKTKDPERYLGSLNPFHDSQLNYALANTNLKGLVSSKEPNTALIRRLAESESIVPHELTHTLQLRNENRGNKLGKEIYPYVSALPKKTRDKIFGDAGNRFDNPNEVYANLNDYAMREAAAGGDFVNSPEGRALLPDRKSQGQYYANTMPGVQSIYGYREDSNIPEDKFKRDSRDSYATQLVKYAKHKTKDYAEGGIMGTRYMAEGGVTDAPNIPTYNSGTGRYVGMPSAGVSVYDPKNPTGFDPSTGMFRTLKQQNALNPNTNNYIGSGDQDYNYVTAYTNGDSIGTQDNNTDFSQLPGYANLITPTSSEHLNTMYQGMLGRAPDESGIAAFSNMAPDQVTSAIMASAEYQAKNGPPPEPTYYYDRQPMYTPQYVHSSDSNQSYDNGNTGEGPAGGGNSPSGPSGPDGTAGEGGAAGSYAMGGGIGSNYSGFDDHNNPTSSANFNQGPQYPMQQPQNFAYGGGISNLGGYSDGGRLLRGPGDGVSDDIPAQIGDRQPARLADGEFVVPARIVSELGNGSTDAGAKRLYAMMDRVQANRKKTVGKGKVAVNSKSNKYLPA